MRNFISVLLLVISSNCFSQNVKLKKGDILIDGIPWLKYRDCGMFDSTCSLLNNEKEELIFIKTVVVNDAEPISKYNRTGSLSYYEIIFVGQKMKIELKKTQKDIIEIIYNSKAINADGTLNPEKLGRLVEKYGTEYSDRFNKTSNNPSTVIINNSPTPQRSGVNINIGR